jgi:hypothetical protein
MRPATQETLLPKLHVNQQKVIDEAKRFNVVCCGRRWGKTKLSVRLLAKTAIAGLPAGYFTPTYKLLTETYKEAATRLEPMIRRSNQAQFIELVNGGIIDFWTMENDYAGRGRKYALDVIDEAAFTKNLFEKWTQAIRPTLTDLRGAGWFLSTPKGKNDFHKLFMRGKSGEENWMSWQMSTYTNPYIDPEEIDDARRDLPEGAFSQEYMAEFLENAANPFGSAFISQCTFPISSEPAVCFGVDLAKSYDWTVIIGLDRNGSVCYFERFQKDWRQTVQTILNLPNAPIAIDSTGVGDPIGEDIARVREVELVQFTSKSKQQLMEGLAAGIQQRKITFPEGPITDELGNFEYEFTNRGVKYSAPSGLHDDCVCSLALAWHRWQNVGLSYNGPSVY